MRKKKYRSGDLIKNMHELTDILNADLYVMWNHKPRHPAFMIGMAFRTLRTAIYRGLLRRAIKEKGE